MKVTNLMLMSLDGEITAMADEPSSQRLKSGFTCPEDQELLQNEMKASDAIIMGAKTLRVEKRLPELKHNPTWCIYTQKGFDASLPFWKQTQIPRILVSEKPLPVLGSNVESLAYGKNKPAKFLLEELRKRGFKRILLLGGGELNTVFYNEGLVDELKLTIAPLLVGKGLNRFIAPGLEGLLSFELLGSEAKGSHIFLHYRIRHE